MPPYLSEAASFAALVIAVAGFALVITGAAMLVMGLTMGSRFGEDPPPGLATLGLGPALGGAGVLVLGVVLAAGAVAVLLNARRAKRITGAASVLAALLAAAGAVGAMAVVPPDPIVATSLAITTLALGVGGLILLRPAR
jgi:hypothetical protein